MFYNTSYLHNIVFSGFLFLFTLPTIAQPQNTTSFQVIWWNVENLFDCEHDSLKNDYDFLPKSIRHWSYHRFTKKLDQIAQTIVAIGKWNPPAVIGLCEVENDNVLTHLTKYSSLKNLKYRYIMTHCADLRGINIALLYQRDQFKLLNSQCIRVARKNYRPTRDILHVTGLILSQDTLDLFLCHLPSRAGGNKTSEAYRILAAQTLKHTADSVCKNRINPNIIIMGDFNDDISNKSIKEIMQIEKTISKNPDRNKWYHLLYKKTKQQDYGSYKYKGIWQLLDHFIVSGQLLSPSNSLKTTSTSAHISHLPFLLENDRKFGGVKPLRTYNGMIYQGGISDHLPIYVDFDLTW